MENDVSKYLESDKMEYFPESQVYEAGGEYKTALWSFVQGEVILVGTE